MRWSSLVGARRARGCEGASTWSCKGAAGREARARVQRAGRGAPVARIGAEIEIRLLSLSDAGAHGRGDPAADALAAARRTTHADSGGAPRTTAGALSRASCGTHSGIGRASRCAPFSFELVRGTAHKLIAWVPLGSVGRRRARHPWCRRILRRRQQRLPRQRPRFLPRQRQRRRLRSPCRQRHMPPLLRRCSAPSA